ncbi:DUF397 domain-containing protein [Streptomyces sp. NPDC052396]|uniref:DUF397 domain-containing protein n=1 Tax=Streptomyces sp. NPDC052396 TaxID=3365689 RepID=UPI0037D04E54
MTKPDLTQATWRKSTRSNSSSNCVEVSDDFPGIVPVRDSKDPSGPALLIPSGAWSSFVSSVKDAPEPGV